MPFRWLRCSSFTYPYLSAATSCRSLAMRALSIQSMHGLDPDRSCSLTQETCAFPMAKMFFLYISLSISCDIMSKPRHAGIAYSKHDGLDPDRSCSYTRNLTYALPMAKMLPLHILIYLLRHHVAVSPCGHCLFKA